MKVNTKTIAQEIADNLMYRWNDIFISEIYKDCDIAIENIKENLLDEVINILEKENIDIKY